MREVVVTSFSPAGAKLYGRRMVREFFRYWPPSTALVVYVDQPMAIPGAEVRLTTDLADWQACRRRWSRDAMVHGRDAQRNPKQKPYHYRYDAARFAVKMFVQHDAARTMGAGVLTWLDGDTVTTHVVPTGWTADLLGGADVAYLGRGRMHPETGYVGFRIPEALPLLEWCCEAYRTEAFRQLGGWTDCHVLQAALAALPVRARDWTTERYVGKSHIWPVSPLAPYVTHFKGSSQKRLGAACSAS